ncbi:hypothetical protein [Phenylobacterium sp.]|uniref:hypothetical protein n=1 Tax=Phenylobacterium sp. TaxID=1871053 RepID=UPI0025F6AB46|nr:hypothetical protein [Phenylobacterium sp.]
MRALRLALAVAALAGPATAQATLDAAGRETVQVRTRPDVAGDVYRYRSETRFVQKDDQGGQSQTNAMVFDLQVLGVGPEGPRMRYTLREASLQDSGGASMGAAMNAAVGGSLDFRLGPQGQVVGVENWPAYRTRLLARVDAALPPSDPVRGLIHERMSGPPLETAQDMVLGDVVIMALMEPRGGLPLGLSDLKDPDAGKATLAVSVRKPGCVVALERETNRTAGGAVRAVVSKAELAVGDGRILTLEERRVTRAPGGSQEETVTIRRLDAPSC